MLHLKPCRTGLVTQLFFATLALGTGVIVVLLDNTPFVFLSLMFLYIFVIVFIKFPKETLLIFGIFLLLQDLLVGTTFPLNSLLNMVLKRADEVAIAVMLLVILFGRRPLKLGVYLPLTGLVLAGAVSTIRAGAPLLPAVLDLFLMLKGFLLFIIAAHLPYGQDDVEKFNRVFGVIGLLIMLVGLLDLVLPPWQEAINLSNNVQYRGGLRSAQAIFSHPGLFGQVMTYLLLYSLSFFAILRKRQALLLCGLFGLGILLSLRLKPLLSIPVAILAGLVIFRGKGRSRVALSVAGLGLVAFFVFQEKISQVIYIKSGEFEEGARLILFQTSLQIARDYFPFGTGLGTFGGWASRLFYSPVYHQYGLDKVFGLTSELTSGQDFVMDTHWPYVLGETGILGFFFYLLVLYYIVSSVRRLLVDLSSPLRQAFALGVLFSLIAAIVESFASPVFQTSIASYFTLFAAGVAHALGRNCALQVNKIADRSCV